MPDASQTRCRRGFWVALAAVTAVHLLAAGRVGLSVDEAHYLQYARHPAWGYFDHPPMVGFLGWLTTRLGESPAAVRLGPILCAALTFVLLRRLALALYADERVALRASLWMWLMPAAHLLCTALLPDATLSLFWCGTLLAAWRALHGEGWGPWALAGALFGGALLSKYHAVLLPICLFGFVATSPGHRRWLRRPQPYLACAIGALVFLPNVLWNARHQWLSYAYQAAHGRGGSEFTLAKVAASLGGQLAAASPLVPALLIAAWVVLFRERRRREEDRYILWTSLPVFAFFCGTGFWGKILPHWPFVGWWTGALGLASVTLLRADAGGALARRWRGWSAAAGAVGAASVLFTYAALLRPIGEPVYEWARGLSLRLHRVLPAVAALEPFRPGLDIPNDLYGWGALASQAGWIVAGMPNPDRTFVFCPRSHMTSLRAVYLDRRIPATSLARRNDQYRLWFSAPEHRGWDAVFLDDASDPVGLSRYAALFVHVNPVPVAIEARRGGRLAHAFNAYRLYGYRGIYEGDVQP
jgi:hypothetical protein